MHRPSAFLVAGIVWLGAQQALAQEPAHGAVGGQAGVAPARSHAGAGTHAAAADPTFYFDSFVRWPSENGDLPDPWFAINMENGNTAYYRDVLIGARTYLTATPGVTSEYWDAVFTAPDTSTFIFSPVTYYASWSGLQHCFVTSRWYICGTTNIGVVWYISRNPGQCRPTGQWQADFGHNGANVFARQFDLLPQIEEVRIPFYSQDAYSDAYDSICRTNGQRDVFACPDPLPPNVSRWSIAAKGCALTSSCMVLGYHGVNVDPPTLNTWLTNNGGYDSSGAIYWDKVAEYGRTVGGRNISYIGSGGDLFSNTCTYGPHVVHMSGRNHWLTAYGKDRPLSNWLVKDPNGGRIQTLNTVTATRFYSGPEYTFTDAINGISFRFHSPVEAFVRDPQGRRLGYDPTSGATYNEIPGASYTSLGLDDDETGDPQPDPGKELEVMAPTDGDYTYTVTGTGTGTYDAELRVFRPATAYDSRATQLAVPTAPGVVHTYAVHYSSTSGAPTTLSGGFAGGGQRPRDVDRFLTYASPAASPVSLPAGTTSYLLFVYYDRVILPATFKATLNGADIGASFHPAPGGGERVDLPLVPGRNVLVLSVDGQLPSRVATDTDRLVLLVQ